MRGRINFRQRLHQRGNALTNSHADLFFPTIALARARALRAQANSVARIARPIGITMKAGPGKTIKATPIKSTVPPTIAMTSFRSDATTNLIGLRCFASMKLQFFCSRRPVGDAAVCIYVFSHASHSEAATEERRRIAKPRRARAFAEDAAECARRSQRTRPRNATRARDRRDESP